MDEPSVLLISYAFYPSNEVGARRPTAYAQFLASKGLKVIVVSAFGGKEIPAGAEILPGVVAIPARGTRRLLIDGLVALRRHFRTRKVAHSSGVSEAAATKSDGASRKSRMLRDFLLRTVCFGDVYKRWGRRAYSAALKAGKKSSVVVVLSSSPPPTVLVVGTLAARALGVPHIADLRDPWTDQMERTDWFARQEFQISRSIEGWVLKSSAAVLSAGVSVARLLASRYPEIRDRIVVIRNGYDGGFVSRTVKTGGTLSILFAGELYRSRDPFPFLETLEYLLRLPDISPDRVSVTFMGEVESYRGQYLAEWLKGRHCEALVRILPRQPPDVVNKAMGAATVLLNFAQGQPLQIPAKTYEHLANSREVLVLCESDSETAQVVAGIVGVNQVDPADRMALRTVLLDLYRRHVLNGELLAPQEKDITGFSRETSNQMLWAVIKSVVKANLVR